jgi:hypothetical protein
VHFVGLCFTNIWLLNPLNAELNPICKSQLAELFWGVFKFCACFSKNLNISRTKQEKFVKQKAFCGEGNRHWSECLKNSISSLVHNGEDRFLNKLVNIHVLLLTLWSRLHLFFTEDGWYNVLKVRLCVVIFKTTSVHTKCHVTLHTTEYHCSPHAPRWTHAASGFCVISARPVLIVKCIQSSDVSGSWGWSPYRHG